MSGQNIDSVYLNFNVDWLDFKGHILELIGFYEDIDQNFNGRWSLFEWSLIRVLKF